MKKKINIAELLKDCPKGMELDCILYDNIYFDTVEHNSIKCYIQNKGYRTSVTFDVYGGLIDPIPTKCVIFPKGKTTWEGFHRPFKETWQFSRLATEEEKQKLFDAIKAHGYKWNEETKTLEKILNKFDITTLIPFESGVLVRNSDDGMWRPTFWGKYLENSIYSYLTSGGDYKQCIPYEGNEHLLGTNNDCDEFYKTW